MKKIIYIILIIVLSIISVYANDFENLCKNGYAVTHETRIYDYDFDGCEYNKVYKLANGMKFICTSYNYHYSYNPRVYILQNRYGNYKVIIDDEEFQGRLSW